jgi:hypothetical protein
LGCAACHKPAEKKGKWSFIKGINAKALIFPYDSARQGCGKINPKNRHQTAKIPLTI